MCQECQLKFAAFETDAALGKRKRSASHDSVAHASPEEAVVSVAADSASCMDVGVPPAAAAAAPAAPAAAAAPSEPVEVVGSTLRTERSSISKSDAKIRKIAPVCSACASYIPRSSVLTLHRSGVN
jgi:hypothetical protein